MRAAGRKGKQPFAASRVHARRPAVLHGHSHFAGHILANRRGVRHSPRISQVQPSRLVASASTQVRSLISVTFGANRAAAADKTVVLKAPREITLEIALEFIEDDELVEIAPQAFRLRKRHLKEVDRKRAMRGR